MPNDAGDWEPMNPDACTMNICDPQTRQIDWGSTRANFSKFRRSWKTRILCLDQIRHIEEAAQQLEGIWKGLMKVPEYVKSDWLKFQQVSGANVIYICGSADTQVTVTSAMFTGGLNKMDLGGAGNVPTSKLSMPYLMRRIPPLMYNGYFDGEFTPAGKFKLYTDIQTAYELCNGNPALTDMYDAADFEKGGKYFQYGAMMGCGNFMLTIVPYPARFYHTGSGVMQRVWPFQNKPATIGLTPILDPQYENAPYQISVLPHRKARTIFVGEIPSVPSPWKFGSRDLWGKWQWINQDMLSAYDPNTGAACTMDNPRHNKGYFLVDFEAGVENARPELECVILHQREPQGVANNPAAANPGTWASGVSYQSLLPYNAFCDPNATLEDLG